MSLPTLYSNAMNASDVMESKEDSDYERPVSPGGEFRASFDLTDFGDAETWLDAVENFDFEEAEVEYDKGTDSTSECFVWFNEDLTVRTYANPRTGERAGMPERTPEPGYASYIHVVGDEEAVTEFYEWVKMRAEHIKEASLGKWVV